MVQHGAVIATQRCDASLLRLPRRSPRLCHTAAGAMAITNAIHALWLACMYTTFVFWSCSRLGRSDDAKEQLLRLASWHAGRTLTRSGGFGCLAEEPSSGLSPQQRVMMEAYNSMVKDRAAFSNWRGVDALHIAPEWLVGRTVRVRVSRAGAMKGVFALGGDPSTTIRRLVARVCLAENGPPAGECAGQAVPKRPGVTHRLGLHWALWYPVPGSTPAQA